MAFALVATSMAAVVAVIGVGLTLIRGWFQASLPPSGSRTYPNQLRRTPLLTNLQLPRISLSANFGELCKVEIQLPRMPRMRTSP